MLALSISPVTLHHVNAFIALVISFIGCSLNVRIAPLSARPLRAVSVLLFLAAKGKGIALVFGSNSTTTCWLFDLGSQG